MDTQAVARAGGGRHEDAPEGRGRAGLEDIGRGDGDLSAVRHVVDPDRHLAVREVGVVGRVDLVVERDQNGLTPVLAMDRDGRADALARARARGRVEEAVGVSQR